jgi:phosphate-selective porin OprO/OprP
MPPFEGLSHPPEFRRFTFTRFLRVLGCPVLAIGLLGAGAAQAAEAGEGPVRLKGRLLVDSLNLDVSRPGRPDEHADGIQVRQAYLGLDADLTEQLSLRFEGGAANNDALIWDEVALEYRLASGVALMAGNLKAAGLENLTSTKSLSFLERGPYGELITDGFTSAVQVRANVRGLTATLAFQGESFNNLGLDFDGPASPGAREQRAVTARVAGGVPLGGNTHLHLGAWVRGRSFDGDFPHAYSYQPAGSQGVDGPWLDTGPLARSDSAVAVEAAWRSGSFWIQGEAALLRPDPSPQARVAGSPNLKAGYLIFGWNPQGEVRGYDTRRALFLPPGPGSIDLIARYDFADVPASPMAAGGLQDAPDTARVRGVTLGAVWRVQPGYRFLLNLGDLHFDPGWPGSKSRVRSVQIRAQYDF